MVGDWRQIELTIPMTPMMTKGHKRDVPAMINKFNRKADTNYG